MRRSLAVPALALIAGLNGTLGAGASGLASEEPEPYIFVFGSEPVMGGAAIPTGGTLTVHGRGFCGRAACPAVVLRVGSDQTIEPVTVKDDGTFVASVSTSDRLGSYFLVATQEVEGQVVQAAAPFAIVPRDEPEGQDPGVK